MRHISFVLLVLLIGMMTQSCEKIKGKGEVVTETRYLTGYTSVELAIEADVYISDSANYDFRMEAQENILEVIETKQDGDRLIIKMEKGKILGKHDPIRIWIKAPNVDNLHISGSGNIIGESSWSADECKMSISGSGDIIIPGVIADKVEARISGSGNITVVEGEANREDLSISGSGDIDMLHVSAQTVYATISGSGNILLTAVVLLDGTISGSGSIRYLGDPVVNSHISGSGSITRY